MTKWHNRSASPSRDSLAEPNEQAFIGKHSLVDSMSTVPLQRLTHNGTALERPDGAAVQLAVGKQSLVEQTFGHPSIPGAVTNEAAAAVDGVATRGMSGAGSALPYLEPIQRSFGRHDVSGVQAHQGPAASRAAHELGARAYAFGNAVAFAGSPDLHTAAHEAAHVVQQRGGVQLKGGVGQPGDEYERHADAVADAVVAERSVEALLDATPGGQAGGPALQRQLPMGQVGGGSHDDTPKWKKKAGSAKEYVQKHGQAIIDGLRSQIASVPFETGMDRVAWAAGNAHGFAGQFALEFFLQRDDPWQFLVTTLAPDDVERLIDKGRDALAMPDMAHSYNPGIQIELGNAYKARIRESLLRITPRYVAAWNQHVLADEARLGQRRKNAPLPAAPEPIAAEVVASAPMDPYVIRALRTQLNVDFPRYRALDPDERQARAIKGIDKVTLEIQWRQQAINWVRATPPDATAEDVAVELYGSETLAYLITPAAPLFGFRSDPDNLGKLKPTYREQLQRIQGRSDYHGSHVPAHGLVDDPIGQVLGGPLAAEATKNQAKDVPPTPNLTKPAVVERMRVIVGEFDWLQQSVKPWGQETLLDEAKHKVDQRSRELDKTGDPAAGAEWDGQSQIQLEVVQTARNAVQVAARQEEAFKTFPSARWLIVHLVRDYVEAAAISDLGATARSRLAAAEQKSRMFAADLMEALLETLRPVIHSAKIKKTKLEGRAGEWDDARYGAGAMERKELALRQGLARVRDVLMEHPEKAKPELDRLLAEVTELSTEVTLVSNMDSCDAAWVALDASLSKVGAAVSVVSSQHGNAPIRRDMAAIATMRLQWKAIYDKWKVARTPGDKKAAEDELAVKAKSKEWTELFDAIRKDIADHETYDKWVTFGVMVGITIITGGIGAYVEAAAGAAWGAAAGFAAGTVAEAASFTALSHTLVQSDPSLAGLFKDFESNVLMFGGLKAVGKVWGISGAALGLAHDESAAGGVLVQFAALNGSALYEADRDKRMHTGGQGLTGDEIASISFGNLAFLVAMSIGQRIARPFLLHVELRGQLQGELIAVHAADAKVERLAKQVEADKGKDPAKVHQLNQALAAALGKREAVLARLGEQVKLYEAGKPSGLTKTQYERIKADQADHAEQAADFERAQILDLLEPAGPNRFEVADHAAMSRVVSHYGKQAALIGVDPVTSARTYEVRPHDAAPWRVTERVHAKPGQTTRGATTTAPGRGSADANAPVDGNDVGAHSVPGSRFSGRRGEGEPTPTFSEHEVAPMTAGAVEILNLGEKGFRNVMSTGDNRLLITNGSKQIRAKVVIGEPMQQVATHDYQPGAKEVTITISREANLHDITRAAAHEIAEIQALLVDPKAVGPDALVKGSTSDQLSAHDEGRLAELKVLLYELDNEPSVPRRDEIRSEIDKLLDHVGLDKQTVATDVRAKKVLGPELTKRVDQLAGKRLKIKRSQIRIPPPEVRDGQWTFLIKADIPGFDEPSLLAQGGVSVDANGLPEGGPDFNIDKRVEHGGSEHRIDIEGIPSLTDFTLAKGCEAFEKHFGHPPTELPGTLGDDNKAIFQRVYVSQINKGVVPKTAERLAAAETPFAQARARRGYTDLDVTVIATKNVLMGIPPQMHTVPTTIHVTARKSK
jgi:hypothetical protein